MITQYLNKVNSCVYFSQVYNIIKKKFMLRDLKKYMKKRQHQ